MALPTTRAEFSAYCLRRLGSPVINIEVDDDQIDDRIEDALKYWVDYHFDGSEKVYYRHAITAADKVNKFIRLPDNIFGAVRIFSLAGMAMGSGNMFDIRYQIALNDLYTLTSHSMVPYYMTMQHLSLIEQLLVGEKPIRYNRHSNRLYIDMDWNKQEVGSYLMVEAYSVIDPDVYTNAWADRWLLQYATALIKLQWGSHLKKFANMAMPNGQILNGQIIYDEAENEISKLESEMLNSYSEPPRMMIG